MELSFIGLVFFREVAEDIVINNSEKIGDDGVEVEINESKFGKKYSGILLVLSFFSYKYTHLYIGKYNLGKLVNGVWVFCGVERGTGRCFLVNVQDRSATTLLAIIKEWIKPGTVIISDCWKAYDNIK
jgi:hypothetical protein